LAELLRAELLTEVRPRRRPQRRSAICAGTAMMRAKICNAVDSGGKIPPAARVALQRSQLDTLASPLVASLEWAHAAERTVVHDDLLAIDQTEARLSELDAQLRAVAETERYRTPLG
jgi:hypothetical protein